MLTHLYIFMFQHFGAKFNQLQVTQDPFLSSYTLTHKEDI